MKAAVNLVKRGCILSLATIFAASLALFLWPYRAETIESTVSVNKTDCSISMTSNGGWKNEMYIPGIKASRVAYPLDVRVFVDGCRGVPEGRPYSADLVSLNSGKVIAQGMYCAGTNHSEGYPCQLELPPLGSLTEQDRYSVGVRKTKNEKVATANLRLYLKTEWRSVAIDGMMSV